MSQDRGGGDDEDGGKLLALTLTHK